MRLNKTLFEKAESYNDKGNSTLLFSSSFLLILILVPALTLFVNSCAHQAPNPPVSESVIKEQKALRSEQTIDAKVVKPDTKCDICGGLLTLDKYTIENNT